MSSIELPPIKENNRITSVEERDEDRGGEGEDEGKIGELPTATGQMEQKGGPITSKRDSILPYLSAGRKNSSLATESFKKNRTSVSNARGSIAGAGAIETDLLREDNEADIDEIGRQLKKSNKGNPTHSIWDRLKEVKGDDHGVKSGTDSEENLGDTMDIVFAGQGKSPEEFSERRSKRFRILARMVKNNLTWAREMESKHEDTEEDTAFVVHGLGDETLVFDVGYYKAKNKSYGGITPRVRRLLLKHPLERQDDDIAVLKNLVERLQCFDKYSSKVKESLARVICYESYEDGRVIIQQGHIGVSFYFITSGKVVVKMSAQDKSTGQQYNQVLGELSEGSSFGELALLHDIRRTATIICKGHCEFLRLDKEDFERVLRTNYEEEWSERLRALSWLPQFQDWTKAELESCNNTCKLKEYSRNKIVFGPRRTYWSDYVHFIVDGECQLVREVILGRETLAFGKARYRFLSDSELDEIKGRNLKPGMRRHKEISKLGFMPERKLWTIGTLKRGHFFSVGEDMTDTYIISKDRTEILMVPRVQFLKYDRTRIIDQMKEALSSVLPSNDHIYHKFYDGHKWEKFKQNVVKEVVRRKAIPHTTKIKDVPLTIRMESLSNAPGTEEHYFEHLLKPQGKRKQS